MTSTSKAKTEHIEGVDALAQEIRRVDGENSLGAGALAEALLPFFRSIGKDRDAGDWVLVPRKVTDQMYVVFREELESHGHISRFVEAYAAMLAAAPPPPASPAVTAYADLLASQSNIEPDIAAAIYANRSALYVASPAVTVGVKGLEWVKTHNQTVIWRAHSILGIYRVFFTGNPPAWTFEGYDGEVGSGDAESGEAAKAAAQSDYETRIRSALTSPAGETAQVEALRKIAGSHFERVGYDQTDIDDVPDLTASEAMTLARAALTGGSTEETTVEVGMKGIEAMGADWQRARLLSHAIPVAQQMPPADTEVIAWISDPSVSIFHVPVIARWDRHQWWSGVPGHFIDLRDGNWSVTHWLRLSASSLSAKESPEQLREVVIEKLNTVRRRVFGDIGDSPNVYADYDRCLETERLMSDAILTLSGEASDADQ